jgi:large repetitive protein
MGKRFAIVIGVAATGAGRAMGVAENSRRFTPVGMLAATLGLTVALLALAPTTASAQPLTCGQVITKDTTLHADLGPCPGDGLVIGANKVTLDLNGHAIVGDDTDSTGDDVGVRNDAGHVGTVVENGRIRRFATSIRLDGADHTRVSHIATNPGCCDGPVVEVLDSSDSRIGNNLAIASGSFGDVFVVSGSHNRVDNNVARGGGQESGFEVSGWHNTITGNANRELGGVAVWGSWNRITDNYVDEDELGSFSVRGARNLIARNSVPNVEAGLGVSGPSNVIRNNVLGDHPNVSIAQSLSLSDCRNVRVEGNVVHNGITAFECQNARIEDNSLLGVGMGIYGGSGNSIRENTVSGAIAVFGTGDGIGLYGGSDNSIEKNTISDADLSAIFVGESPFGDSDPSVGTTVRGNLVTRSGSSSYSDNNDDGIHVEDPGTVIAGNAANNNADLGIQAVPEVIDGGGNTAFGNGNPLQCLNVVCN